MSATKAFRSFGPRHASPAARRAEAELRERVRVEREIRNLVAALPNQQAFDDWISGFPEEYRDDMRRTFASACAFPRVTDGQPT